jgi:cytochrome c
VFRQCAACHNVVNDAGDVLAGRPNMRTGPNLYGQMGETSATRGFPLVAGPAGPERAGIEITEENFVAYIQDPTGFIQEQTGDDGLRGAMAAQRMRGDTDAADLYAYLVSLAAE